jgi:hypothetical protein
MGKHQGSTTLICCPCNHRTNNLALATASWQHGKNLAMTAFSSSSNLIDESLLVIS